MRQVHWRGPGLAVVVLALALAANGVLDGDRDALEIHSRFFVIAGRLLAVGRIGVGLRGGGRDVIGDGLASHLRVGRALQAEALPGLGVDHGELLAVAAHSRESVGSQLLQRCAAAALVGWAVSGWRALYCWQCNRLLCFRRNCVGGGFGLQLLTGLAGTRSGGLLTHAIGLVAQLLGFFGEVLGGELEGALLHALGLGQQRAGRAIDRAQHGRCLLGCWRGCRWRCVSAGDLAGLGQRMVAGGLRQARVERRVVGVAQLGLVLGGDLRVAHGGDHGIGLRSWSGGCRLWSCGQVDSGPLQGELDTAQGLLARGGRRVWALRCGQVFYQVRCLDGGVWAAQRLKGARLAHGGGNLLGTVSDGVGFFWLGSRRGVSARSQIVVLSFFLWREESAGLSWDFDVAALVILDGLRWAAFADGLELGQAGRCVGVGWRCCGLGGLALGFALRENLWRVGSHGGLGQRRVWLGGLLGHGLQLWR